MKSQHQVNLRQIYKRSGKWLRGAAGLFLLIGIYVWALQALNINVDLLRSSLPHMLDFCSRLFPPDWSILDLAVKALLQTIQMSLIGTTLGALLSLPIAALSAHTISPLWVCRIANFLQNAIRSVPSMVLGLFFVAATGLGAPAGTLALGIYTIGYLAKFYQEAIESVDRRSLEFFQVSGASWLQTLRYGILPQVLPLFLGYTIYMFEYNIRAASVLGVVGAGGIGFELVNYFRSFEYQKATTMMIVVLAVVICVDFFSSQLRRKLSQGSDR
jgi:phosphonate transport system permease protein